MTEFPPKLRAVEVGIEYRDPRRDVGIVALEHFDVTIDDGEFLTIVGPSGCGKTTFLNAVAGMVRVTSGSLTLDGREIVGPGHDRAMVFQQPHLLPWRTVRSNVAYGLEIQGSDRSLIRERVGHLIQLVGLRGFEESYPAQLSGGMQQRCNLARALATDPQILLLDEPFAALDAQTREFMQLELLDIWARARKTALFVTHQIDEAVYLADRVLVMGTRPGRVIDTVTIDIPRPRPLDIKSTPRFLEHHHRIWVQVVSEAAKTGMAHGRVAVNGEPGDLGQAAATNRTEDG